MDALLLQWKFRAYFVWELGVAVAVECGISVSLCVLCGLRHAEIIAVAMDITPPSGSDMCPCVMCFLS